MPQTKQQIQSLLAEANTEPRHRFGQNFMIDQNLVRLVAEAGQVKAGRNPQLVIEVGPGTGTLTDELLARGAEVLAVEIDRDLAALLRTRLGGNERFQLVEGDALAGKRGLNPEMAAAISHALVDDREVKLVANLPYNIASPLIIELLQAGVGLLAFTVQKEVADRLRAPADSEAYGGLSVMAQLLSKVEVLRTLPPQAFWPAPKIDSSLVRMTRADRLGTQARAFGEFVQSLFSARRKTLRKALAQAGHDEGEKVLEMLGISGKLRPENLAPEQFLAVYEGIESAR